MNRIDNDTACEYIRGIVRAYYNEKKKVLSTVKFGFSANGLNLSYESHQSERSSINGNVVIVGVGIVAVLLIFLWKPNK